MKKLKFFTANPFYLVLCLLGGLLFSVPSVADNTGDTLSAKQLQAMARDYVAKLFPAPKEGKMEYTAVPLDKRIKIKSCSNPLQLSIPGTSSLSKQTTVLVRCPQDLGWNIYIQVRISQQVPVVVAKVPLAPGMMAGPDYLTTRMVDITLVRGRTLQEASPLFGAKINTYISAGQPVTMRQVCLVCKGDSVTIVAKLKGLRIKTVGISQQNGSLGDSIAILNQRSNKRIKARVVAVNQVEVVL